MDFVRAKEILIAEAKAQGIKDYEIYFTASENLGAETLKDEISSFSSGSGAGISFRCVIDGKSGTAATELFEENEIKSLVTRAAACAQVIENNESADIFGGSESYAEVKASDFEMPTAADVKALALDVQKKIYAESDLITDGTQSGVSAVRGRYELVNSKGLELSNTVSYGVVFAQAVVNRDGESQGDFDYTTDLSDTDGIVKNAVSGAIATLGATTIPSGKYDVIFDGKQMRALLSTYSSVFSGKNALLGLSLLKGKEGEKVAADCVTLVDDPMREGSCAKTSFDGEGVAAYKKNVIEDGILKTLLYDLSTAAKAGVATTANGQRASFAQQAHIAPFCFYIAGGKLGEQQLLQRMGDGIYITELKGLHAGADAVTGDFSIESAGYLVENGQKTRAIKGFTVAGNFFELLKGIDSLADNVKFGLPSGFTSFGAPDTLVKGVSVAGS